MVCLLQFDVHWGAERMVTVTASAEPLVSYHAARLWAILVTAILAVVAGGFLIPWFNRLQHNRLHKKFRVAAGNSHSGAADPVKARLDTTGRRAANGVLALFLGKDGRLSTSTTIAWVWTVVISWVILSLVIAWPPDWSAAFTNFDGTYIALLGGPYAAWVLARVAVSARVGNSTLQKRAGDGIPRLSDLVSGDDGNPDLFDVQYVMFNLIAVAFVVLAFTHASENGFPLIPPALVLLTGGPAAVYAANKTLATNGPVIFSVSPGTVNTESSFTVYGQNFLAGAAASGTAGNLRVLAGGRDATVDTGSATDSAVSAAAPATDYSETGPLAVTVITPAGAQALLNGQLTIRTAPTLTGADRMTVAAGGVVTLAGAWYPPGDAPLTVVINGTLAVAPSPGPTLSSSTAQLTVPPVGSAAPIQIHVMQYGQLSANSVSVTISA